MQTSIEDHDFGTKRRKLAVIGSLSQRVSKVNRSEFPVKICNGGQLCMREQTTNTHLG